MNTGVLYYKIFERKVLATDYIEWAFYMLHNGKSTPSLNVLVSLSKPLNTFEVEEYFNRAITELNIAIPSSEESARHYVRYLLRETIDDPSKAIDNAYDIYKIVREHFLDEEQDIWYEISEMIDDLLYGDNIKDITRTSLTKCIVLESEHQLKNEVL
ncbi:hypothetical protein CSV63_02160 [Sporosarcina sp. P34]|uniref:hypothetical protein n=1 Tax=Sporosarcina sp. P34 TaxID=2048247 RepID=UPI000C17042C|nr:hypothetical protein [Sporosarcina sp. P34]PID16713.1 hypothetical protein CSV63_02160 [Sporosarcina sp. P34]